MEYPRCPIETRLVAMAREEAKERSMLGTEEELEVDMRTSALEVSRRHSQARLGVQLLQRNNWRLLRLSGKANESDTRPVVAENMTLEMDRKANVITFTGLEIFPKVGGETIVGTLDVHANGFLYATSSPDFHFHFLYTDVKRTFYRAGDENTPPLLHFHLHHPIKVGAEMRHDIQFRLVQTTSYNDSTRDGEALKSFVHRVEAKWRCYTFGGSEVHKRNEFQGNLPSRAAPTVFGLTCSSLVGLVDEPFVVVNLYEIEIVSLRLKPAAIDMTVVFRDFKYDLVRINSIPIAALSLIKDCCNFAGVKYYEVCQDLDWGSIVKGITDSPREFIANGGWSYYELEDPATADLYQYYEKAESEESLELWDAGEESGAYCGSDDEGEESDTLKFY